MKYLIGIAFVFSSFFANAQDSHVVNTRNMLWPGILGEYKFNGKWSALLDAQFRYEYTDGDIFQWYLRPSVTRKLNNGLLLSLGGGYFQLYPNPNGQKPRPEIRSWQEAGWIFKRSFHHTFYPRVRFEQRFIREYAGTGLAPDFSFNSYRVRLRFDYTYTFGKESAAPWSLIAGNELFFFQKPSGFSAFDQDRVWIGTKYAFNASHAVVLSYVYLHQQINSRRTDAMHIIRLIYQFTLTRESKNAAR